MADKFDLQAVIDTARQSVAPSAISPTGANLLFKPLAHEGAVIDLQEFVNAPRRLRGSVTVFDVSSLIELIRATQNAVSQGQTRIYIDNNVDKPSVVAVLNDTAESGPAWRDARITLVLRETPQWKKWKAIDGKLLSQLEFAEFIEDNSLDILDPPGADMLEIAQELQATRKGEFKSAQRIANGSYEFINTEEIAAKVGTKAIAVPAKLTLAMPPYEGMSTFKMEHVRFRYRLDEGVLRMGIKLERAETLIAQVLTDIKQALTEAKLPIILGLPG